MKADRQTETEVKALLEEAWRRYEQKDVDAFMDLWTSDPDLVAIGTGGDEIRLGPEELRHGIQRDFVQAENLGHTIEWLRISAAGNTAWSAAHITLTATVNENDVTLPCRMTNVYERRGETWRIAQLHLSLPAADQEAGQSYPPPQRT